MKSFYVFPLSLLLLTACKSKKEAPKQNTAPQATVVDVIVAGLSGIDNTIEANGTVVAGEYVELHPEVSGRLTYLNVPEGAQVQQGTVIARINDADLQAQLNKTRVLLDMATKTEERLRKLLSINGVNQADYDVSLNAVNGYKADMAYTQSLIDKTVLKAPFSGVAGLRQVSPGAYVSPASIIVTIQQLDKIKIDFTLPEEYSNLVKKGNSVDVMVDTRTQAIKKALIIATEPQVNLNTRNLKVRAVLQDSKANPGAYVKVMISSDKAQKSILVPTNAIIPDDKNKILVLVKNGMASFINVETGRREANNIEITRGIHVGDSVVITGVLFAKPKAQLKVRSVKTLEQLIN
ncbi:MAG: efflux RND transporter periplasmic adaptor subunit [Chitinophagaceae bacterium]|nr:efflux RND transporter periplasmic adaptor subunit [Chitinophagaceae bacterium]MDP1764579.1 efflux RND transporter periplasmic adaptor subunit [Sediminibacterium sp.]MDP3666688.1 efflux RND transporter periplasmic adaptor subunit [Sediminibacterium sp.]